MADSRNADGFLARLRRRADHAVDSLKATLGRRLADLDARLEELVPRLATRQNMERFQSAMGAVVRIVYGIGFSVDPDAERLLAFMDWTERRHGRRAVLEGLQEHNPIFRSSFTDILQASRQRVAPGEPPEDDLRERLEEYREAASTDVLRFLAHLASHETSEQPPAGDPEALESYIRSAELPARFLPLVDRARGTTPASDGSSNDDPARHPDGSDETLGDQVRALARRSVGFDRQLQFLSVGFLFASQGFMTRTALENLPELIERSDLDDPDDIVDV